MATEAKFKRYVVTKKATRLSTFPYSPTLIFGTFIVHGLQLGQVKCFSGT